MARILIIDDEEPLRRVMRNAVEQAGHEALDASDGREGLALLQQTLPDLVVTDLFMSEKDGIQVLLSLRELPEKPKIIVMTGGDSQDLFGLKSSARLLGADRVLSKPFDMQTFLQTVEEVLAAKPAVAGVVSQARPGEQRKHHRFVVDFPALFDDGVRVQAGTVVDISHEGCRIRSAAGVPGEKYFTVEIETEASGQKMEVDLAVMRWSRPEEFGVEFIRMAPESQAQLRRIIRNCEETTAKADGQEDLRQPCSEAGQRAPHDGRP